MRHTRSSGETEPGAEKTDSSPILEDTDTEVLVAFGILIAVVIGLFFARFVAQAFVIPFLRWMFILSPFLVVMPIGLLVWLAGATILGNIIVVVGLVAGFTWTPHFWKHPCNCGWHRFIDRLEKLEI